jgi:hypothetical protein
MTERLPDFTTTARHAKPWHHVGHRILRPFSDPSDLGAFRYCHRCKEWVGYRSEARFEGTVYARKEWCARCGSVITYGVYNQRDDPATARRALTWATEREETMSHV